MGLQICKGTGEEAGMMEGAAAVPTDVEPEGDLLTASKPEEVADDAAVPKTVEDTEVAKVAEEPEADKKVEEEPILVKAEEEESKATTEEEAKVEDEEQVAVKAEEETQANTPAAEEVEANADEAVKANTDKTAKEAKAAEHEEVKEKGRNTKKKETTNVKKRKETTDAKKRTNEETKKSSKKDDTEVKKKKSEETQKKKEAEGAEKKQVVEEAAKKEEASGPTSPQAIKEREAQWKRMPAPEKKTRALELLAAAIAGEGSKVIKFIESGTSPNAADGDGWTGLLRAAEKGKSDVITILFDYGADSSLTVGLGEYGFNALHHASRSGHTDAVKLLLARGKKADINAKNCYGKTPREIAANDEIKKLIKKASK